jgi:hypothetical protein
MRSTRQRSLAVILVAALTACSGGQGTAAERVSQATVSATPAPLASPAPAGSTTPSEPRLAFEGATETVATDGFPDAQVDGIAYLTAVRAGRHADFDRVVWTFDGPLPAYRVGYARRPIVEDGSGRPIEVDGDAVLQVLLTPASGTDLSGATPRPVYAGDRRIPGTRSGTTVVREIVETGDFEATMSWVVGLGRQAPFTVTELADPPRVVVDIASGPSRP